MRWLLPLFLAWPLLADAQQLTISAASSLGDAMREISHNFEAAHPGTHLRLNFAASALLVQQLAQGAPVDLIASADQESMDSAERKQLIVPGSRRNFSANQLVLIVPAQDGLPLRQLNDLDRNDVRRIAIGNPASVPAGRYARMTLENAGLWEKLLPKYVQAGNVRQALAHVARGEVQAGFVYRSDALSMAGQVRIVEQFAGLVKYPVAVAREAKQPLLAQQFADYLQSTAAQQILIHHGFSRP